MTKILLSLLLFVLILHSCGPKKVSYEDATKWHSNCIPQPGSHPGDYYAYNEICIKECKSNINSNNNSTTLPNESSQDSSSDAYTSRINKASCVVGCIEKIHPLAMHVEGGYYSDGSYYATCMNPFENIHPTKDKYEKTKWQKDRDECMELTYENVEQTFWSRERSQLLYGKWLNRAMKYYRECLDEKGYYEGL